VLGEQELGLPELELEAHRPELVAQQELGVGIGEPVGGRAGLRGVALAPGAPGVLIGTMLMIPKGYETAAPGAMPDPEAVAAMMKYNEALQAAGVLRALDGLHPRSMGARVSFAGGRPKVTDGPFAEAKEVIGGYWMIEVGSKAAAIEWAQRCPASDNEVIEVRQVQEFSDFPADVQAAGAGFPELKAQAGQRPKS
jgi:hypothetical protein